jgi:hypothetical protein
MLMQRPFPEQPAMASSGRIVCPRCSANNFDTVTVCWKCGTPLRAAPAAAAPVPEPSSTANTALRQVARMGQQAALSATANRSAIALGLLFPYIGILVALAFMMCDDPRRQEVGRICLLWSIISTVLQVLLGLAAMLSLSPVLGAAISGFRGGGGGLHDPGGASGADQMP